MDEYFTIEQLKARGWTGLMIKSHLGKPDEQRSDPSGRLRKPIKLYRRDRVLSLEAGAAQGELEKLSEAKTLARRAIELKKRNFSTDRS